MTNERTIRWTRQSSIILFLIVLSVLGNFQILTLIDLEF